MNLRWKIWYIYHWVRNTYFYGTKKNERCFYCNKIKTTKMKVCSKVRRICLKCILNENYYDEKTGRIIT